MSEFTKKLIEVQKKLKAPKNQYNSFGKYKYRSAEDILEAVKPLNAEQGLLLTLTDEPILIGDRHYIKATARITDGKESHEVTAYARESVSKKGMDDSQITGTASSYARKYALNGLYLIDDTKDADTDEYANQNNQQTNKATDKQLDLVTNLIRKRSDDNKVRNEIFVKMIKELKLDKAMDNWTSQQASQAIQYLQSDANV